MNGTKFLLFAMFLAFFAALAGSSLASADWAAEPRLETLPTNPQYLEYWERVKAGERPGGLMPSPIDWSLLKKEGVARRKARAAAVLPPAYDLVAEGVTPPVVDQLDWGTCWSFASIEAIESAILSADKNNYKRLSELHMAYYAYVDEGPDKPSFTSNPNQTYGRNEIFDNGGIPELVIALLSRGTGPLAYDDAPYPDLDDIDWGTYRPDPAPPTGPAQFRLKNAYYFWDEPDAIKSALMKYGAMAFAFNHDYDTTSGDCIYTPEPKEINHEVLLVGWDDDYPKEAFGPDQPEGDGAWKIQNSWGTRAGTDGFYWISYYDETIFGRGDEEGLLALPAAFEMMPADAYDDDGIYFHDPLGMSAIISATGSDSLTAANVFTSKRDEKIVYVGFMTGQDDQDCEIQVIRDIPDGGAPSAGKAVFATPVPYHVTDGGGYASVKLDDPVQIRKGERFAVTVTFRRPDGDSRVAAPIEERLPGGYAKVSMNPRESYYLWRNEWRDVYYETDPKGNFCLKAFTVASPAPDEGINSGGSGGGGGCDAVSFGLFGILGLAGSTLFALKKRGKF
jgi:C1A family cysteine protease